MGAAKSKGKRSARKKSVGQNRRVKDKKKNQPAKSEESPTTDIGEMLARPETIEKIKEYAYNCLTFDQIATCLGISRASFYIYMDKMPRLREIIDQQKETRINRIAQTLLDNAEKGDNAAERIFALKAQAGWREKSEVVHSGNVKHELEVAVVKRIDQMSPEQRAERLAELQRLEKVESETVIDVEVDECKK